MDKIKLNLCGIGSPTDPKTWSGTPFNIYSELIKTNRCGEAFDANVPKMFKLLISLCSIPFYGKTEIGRGPLRRYLCAFKAAIKTRFSVTNHTLHMGALSLPFLVKPSEQKHYLLCDSTWNLWVNNSTNISKYNNINIERYDTLEKKAISQCEHIFSLSEYVKENLVNYYGVAQNKITVVGTGLGAILPFYGEKDYSNRKILFVAKDRFEDKGGNLVVDSFLRAVRLDPKLQLTIIGNEEIKKTVVHPNIKVLGFIPLQELQDLFNTHSLFFMPAINEPWGLVYLEAMACKMPIIGLNRNSFPELSGYGTYGFGIDTSDPDLIGELIAGVFSKPEELREIGQKAQAFCLDSFSWTITINKIIKTIETSASSESY